MYQLTIPIAEDGTPLYAQIYEYIKGQIRGGQIPAYTRLPSTRRLSADLGVSRSTVQLAYDQLCDEGYLDAEPCRGYFAARVEGLSLFSWNEDKEGGGRTAKESAGERGQTPEGAAADNVCWDFSLSGADLTHFPFNTWRRLAREVFSDETGDILRKGTAQGEERLRQVIREYLRQSRGVSCDPDQIVIGAGNEYLLMLLSQILGGVPIAMEEVTYCQAARVLTAMGHEVVSVPMDGQGMCAGGPERAGVRAAYLMPSHQFPTGIVMPVARRLELLSWAADAGGYLIEDDYDSEFRYRGRPIPAMKSLDREERVIYLGTFSRAIAPAIRISYLVLPRELLARYRQVCGFYACTVPRADQMILARFMGGGYFERHMNRMRAIYKSRHDCLVQSLAVFGDALKVSGENAGVHLTLQDRRGRSEEELVHRALSAGVRVYGISAYRLPGGKEAAASRKSTVLLGFAGLAEEDIRDGVQRLYEAWRP